MATATIPGIAPGDLFAKHQAGEPITLIDVRTPVEFREIHATLAESMPLDRLDPRQVAEQTAGCRLYVICRTGSRGWQAGEKLASAGCEVSNVEGGTLAWEQAGLPVVRGRKVVSLERQVRIAAGSLVLLGLLLAWLVHPYFAGLSAFVGAGLVFAGVTDTCGMGMLLARMPWNRGESTPTCLLPK